LASFTASVLSERLGYGIVDRRSTLDDCFHYANSEQVANIHPRVKGDQLVENFLGLVKALSS